MKLSSRLSHSNRTMELSSAGFIDVVFLLLIFFLVTSTYQQPERPVASNIAVQPTEAARDPRDLEPAIIEVAMESDRPIFRVGGFSTDREPELVEFLLDFVNKQEGAFVRAADEVPFAATAQALAACRQSGFPIVTYLPRRE